MDSYSTSPSPIESASSSWPNHRAEYVDSIPPALLTDVIEAPVVGQLEDKSNLSKEQIDNAKVCSLRLNLKIASNNSKNAYEKLSTSTSIPRPASLVISASTPSVPVIFVSPEEGLKEFADLIGSDDVAVRSSSQLGRDCNTDANQYQCNSMYSYRESQISDNKPPRDVNFDTEQSKVTITSPAHSSVSLEEELFGNLNDLPSPTSTLKDSCSINYDASTNARPVAASAKKRKRDDIVDEEAIEGKPRLSMSKLKPPKHHILDIIRPRKKSRVECIKQNDSFDEATGACPGQSEHGFTDINRYSKQRSSLKKQVPPQERLKTSLQQVDERSKAASGVRKHLRHQQQGVPAAIPQKISVGANIVNKPIKNFNPEPFNPSQMSKKLSTQPHNYPDEDDPNMIHKWIPKWHTSFPIPGGFVPISKILEDCNDYNIMYPKTNLVEEFEDYWHFTYTNMSLDDEKILRKANVNLRAQAKRQATLAAKKRRQAELDEEMYGPRPRNKATKKAASKLHRTEGSRVSKSKSSKYPTKRP